MSSITNSKCSMELVWHSCTNDMPAEEKNVRLILTNGRRVFHVTWKNDEHGGCFDAFGLHIIPGVNSDGYWWADLERSVRGCKLNNANQNGVE